MKEKAYAVYLTETSNELLNNMLENGEDVEGMLEIGKDVIIFTAVNRIIFPFDTFLAEDDSLLFKNGTEYYKFAHKPLETVKAVI